MSEAKKDCQTLVDEWLKFATQMLEEHGEFIPFGCSMDLSGNIISNSADTGEEHPNSQEVIELLKSGFRSQKCELKCTAIFYDVFIRNSDWSNAVAVQIDHKDDYSNIVIFPYKLIDREVSYGVAMLNAGTNDIFGEPKT